MFADYQFHLISIKVYHERLQRRSYNGEDSGPGEARQPVEGHQLQRRHPCGGGATDNTEDTGSQSCPGFSRLSLRPIPRAIPKIGRIRLNCELGENLPTITPAKVARVSQLLFIN